MNNIITIHLEKKLTRDEHLKNLIAIISAMNKGLIQHYWKTGLQYVTVPQIVGITGACENVDTLFRVGNRLDLPLFFTQTGQLSLEQALQVYHGVFTTIQSGRDEEIEDERHLRQFSLTEEEFDCTMVGMSRKNYDENKMYEALLTHIESAIKSAIFEVVKQQGKILEEIYGRQETLFNYILETPFLRISYADAVDLLRKHEHGYLKFGDDLKANHEQLIVKLVNLKYRDSKKTAAEIDLPVFIMKYPKEIKFFNMKVSSQNPQVVLSADLILPYAGEAVGSSVREHDGEKLKNRLLTSTMFKLHQERGGTYNDFTWYIDDIIAAGKTQPHAGYGLGNERLLQFIFGQNDIRLSAVLSLMAQQSRDWEADRRGGLQMFAHKKTILLSIGKLENKKSLLSYIKNLNQDQYTLYTTEKTYEFLKQNKIGSRLVHKISDEGKHPNLFDLLPRNIFDLIINIPTQSGIKKESTDGKYIRKTAIDTGTTLVTDMEVAQYVLNKLNKNIKITDIGLKNSTLITA